MAESRWVEQQLGRPVIKAFNNIYARHLLERGKPAGVAGRIALPVAGDDDAAKTVVLKLVEELGFDGVDAGGMNKSWRQQPGTPVYTEDSTPTVCGAVCTKRAKTARSNGGAPQTARVASPLLPEGAVGHPAEFRSVTNNLSRCGGCGL